MILAAIRALVAGRLDDDTTPTYSNGEIDAAINEGLQLFAFLTLCLQTTATLTLTAGPVYTRADLLPADYLVPLRLTFGGAKIRPARMADLDALNMSWPSATGNTPLRYLSLADTLRLYPSPATEASVQLTYAQAAPVLTADYHVPVIPDFHHAALADYGTYRLLMPQGGAMLAKALGHLKPFTESAVSVAALMRARGIQEDYDTQPYELKAVKK